MKRGLETGEEGGKVIVILATGRTSFFFIIPFTWANLAQCTILMF